ncbi:unnamed protein product [Anisakis simplex]|uniref:Metalloendopeptidase n=1 Tax=Anisakis simplex TaxID=6269 RepID=A0A158PPJ7_ANISI|nr:unnamed protein product [Anisakis simplex]
MCFQLPTTLFVVCVLLMAILSAYGANKTLWQINSDRKANVQFGDLLVSPKQSHKYVRSKEPLRYVSRKGAYDIRWKDNTVPFQLSNQYNAFEWRLISDLSRKKVIMTALLELQRRSCFKFVKRTMQPDYIAIEPLDGCYSYVGRIGGRQLMSLGRDCLANYIIWHEMMHVIGFEHEHQRPDRDAFIRIEYENVLPGQLENFHKLRSDEVNVYDRKYDYNSIMHYDGTAFGRLDEKTMRRLVTMIPLKKGVKLNDNTEFTRLDIEKLNQLGKCNKQSTEKPISAQENCTDKDSRCKLYIKDGLCDNLLYQ